MKPAPDWRLHGIERPRLGDDPAGCRSFPAWLSHWGKKWGKNPHRLQPIPADLDLAKTA